MDLRLSHTGEIPNETLVVSGSKSETNRLLLLQALYPQLVLENTSDSDDATAMRKAILGDDAVVDIHHAGTAMRFLTAYFATQENREVVLTGSNRMKQRPIGILVNALRELGAEVSYLENEGYPPIHIRGKRVTGGSISLAADVSSQYITALLLVAPRLENGLNLTLEGAITSVPYIRMTLALLEKMGVETRFEQNTISVKPFVLPAPLYFTVESDWSSASYFYSIVALSRIGTHIALSGFYPNSLQGDSAVAGIYERFGVRTTFISNQIVLEKQQIQLTPVTLHLNDTPDLAQTIAVTCFGLGIACHLTGLHTLKIKETDRLLALQTELVKLGATVAVSDESLTLEAATLRPDTTIATYGDHRMAMAFAPLALKIPIVIEDTEVVSKSYPNFWHDLKTIGFCLSQP